MLCCAVLERNQHQAVTPPFQCTWQAPHKAVLAPLSSLVARTSGHFNFAPVRMAPNCAKARQTLTFAGSLAVVSTSPLTQLTSLVSSGVSSGAEELPCFAALPRRRQFVDVLDSNLRTERLSRRLQQSHDSALPSRSRPALDRTGSTATWLHRGAVSALSVAAGVVVSSSAMRSKPHRQSIRIGSSLAALRQRSRSCKATRRAFSLDTLSDEEWADSLLERTLVAIDFDFIADTLRKNCSTARAKEIIDDDQRELLADSAEDARALYEAVQEMTTLEDADLVLQERFDIKELVEDCAAGFTLEAPALSRIAAAVENLLRLRNGLESAATRGLRLPRLMKLVEEIELPDDLLDALLEAFTGEDELSSKKFPEVGGLLQEIELLRKSCATKIMDILNSGRYSSYLSDDGYRQFGVHYTLSVKAQHRTKVGVVVDESNSGKTVYVEPYEIRDLTAQLSEKEKKVQATIRRILSQMGLAIGRARQDIFRCVEAAAQVDLTRARMFLGEDIEGEVPEIGEEGIIRCRDARNACLLLRDIGRVVGYRIELGTSPQGLMLSGPNAGGKTVVMKTIGLLALLTRCGIPVPAGESPRVDFFKVVLAEVGDMQTIVDDLSTYSAHLMASKIMLRQAELHHEGALLLVDEAATGTDPMQGAAMARACLEAYLASGARFVATTHSSQLKNWAVEDQRLEIAAMEYQMGRPTFRLLRKQLGESHALRAAERMELPVEVISRAEDLLGEDQKSLISLQRATEDLKDELAIQIKEAELRESAAIAARKRSEVLEAKLQETQLSLDRERAQETAERENTKRRLLEEHQKQVEANNRKLQQVVEDLKMNVNEASDASHVSIVGDSINELQVVVDEVAVEAAKARERTQKMLNPEPLAADEVVKETEWVRIVDGPSRGLQGQVVSIRSSELRVFVTQHGSTVGVKKTQVSKIDGPNGRSKSRSSAGKGTDYSKLKW